jgi:gliding motility-associated-like protein
MANFQVIDAIQADFSMAPLGNPAVTTVPLELFLPQGSVVFQDLSGVVPTEWYWDFGDGQLSDLVNPTHDYTQPGMYFVTLTTVNEFGCIGKIERGPIVIKSPDLFIPNVFSPNDDDNNDVFRVQYQGSQPFELQIFDRWGVLLHATRNKELGWKGLNQKGAAVPEGVYFYSLTIADKAYTGTVTLVR